MSKSKKDKEKYNPLAEVRIPTAKGVIVHKDRKKENRRIKQEEFGRYNWYDTEEEDWSFEDEFKS